MFRHLATIVGTVVGLVLLWSAAGPAATPPPSVNGTPSRLTQIAQIRALSEGDARRGFPVRIRGVVTYYDPAWGQFFVQDGTGGIFVEAAGQRFELRAGVEVVVTGTTGPGDYKPVIVHPSVRVRNRAPLPPARKVRWDDLFTGQEDSQWVSVSGTVRTAGEQEGRLRLQLSVGARRVKVILLALSQGSHAELVGATVRVTGVCGTITDGRGLFLAPQLLVPSWENLVIERPAPSDVFTLPIRRISDVLGPDRSRAGEERVHIQGAVTGFRTNGPLVLEDGTGSMEVKSLSPVLAQNQVVMDAAGFVSTNRTEKVLEDAVVRRLGFGPFPPALETARPSRRPSLSGPDLPVLTAADRIRRLTPEDAARGYPVELRGVITYNDPDWAVMFFQDSTAGIYVYTEGLTMDVSVGDLVRLYGYTGPGDFAPVVRRPLFRIEGKAPMPPIRPSTFGQLITGKEDSQWVSISGVVRSMSNDWGHVNLKLATGSGGLKVILPGFSQRPLPEHLIDASVQVQGVCGSLFDNRRRMIGVQLFVPSLAEIAVDETGASDSSSLRVESVSSIMRFNPTGVAHRVRIQGVVTLFRPGQYLYVQDASDSICVRTAQMSGAGVGDRVDVLGFPAMGHYSRLLMDATFTRIGPGQVPAPLRVSADTALKEALDGALVQTDGYLFDTFTAVGERVLVLESGTGIFQANLQQTKGGAQIDHVPKGSLLRITGICSVDVDNARQPKTVEILLRSPADVAVMAQPSWWTARHMLQVGSVLVALILLAAGWGLTLNYRVRRQTDQIHLQVRKEAALQERYRDLFENANDVICRLDAAGQVASVNQAGESILGYTRAEMRAMKLEQLVVPACRDRFQSWLAGMLGGIGSPAREFEMTSKPGRSVTLEMSPRLVYQDHQPVAVEIIARDVSERQRVAAYTAALSALSQELSVVRTPSDAARVVSEVADRLLGWDAFILDLWQPGQDRARTVLAIDIVDGRRVDVSPGIPEAVTPMMRRILSQGPQLILRDGTSRVGNDTVRFGDVARPAAALMFVPVRKGSRTIGRLSIQSYTPKAYNEDNLKTLQVLADHCAGALERIQAEEALHESQQRYRLLVENSNDLVCELSRDGRYLYASPNYRTITGYAPEELVGRSALDLVHAEDRASARAAFGQGSATSLFRLQFKGGDWRWFEATAQSFDTPEGESRSVVVSRDVTKRKQAEEALQRTEALYRRAITAADAVPYHRDYDANVFTYFGEGVQALTGYSRSEMTPDLWQSRVQEYQFRGALAGLSFEAAVQKVRQGLVRSWQCDCRIITQDGRTRWVADASVEILDDTGRAIGSIGALQDITERKQAEEQMGEQARLLDLAQDAILVQDLERRVLYWNKSAERLYGWTPAEVLGRPTSDLMSREAEASNTAWQELLRKGEWSGELRQTGKRGQEITVASRWNLLRDARGQPKSVLVINTDVTEKRQLEMQFLHSQRVEGIGTLASGIAHDLNNVLAPILMASQMLRGDQLDEESQKLVETIETTARRGADIVRQVLTFARGVEGEKMLLPPGRVVKEAVKLMRQTFPKSIAITPVFGNDLWLVNGDATQLHQVLLNLCLNARDAMPDGGTVEITAANTDLDENFAAMVPDAKPGRYVMLRVRDNGVGIPRAILGKIFDPFFTTKAIGKGTGLGLSTVSGIVKGHSGVITVESQVGKGTTFTVYLPAAPGITKSIDAGAEPSGQPGHGEVVLIVDDEPSIREVTAKMLQRFGYRVLTAGDGTEALATFTQERQTVKVVLTDIMMPNMDGVALARVLRKMDSDVKIIASSGAAGGSDETGQGAELKALNVEAFLRKPYTAGTLLGAIHEALQPKGTAPDGAA